MNPDRKRRRFVTRALAGALGGAATLLTGCDARKQPWLARVLGVGESLNQASQRLVTSRQSLAQEFTEADLSPFFRSNGTANPDTDEYRALAADNFAAWSLKVGGLVQRPADFSLAELRALPRRTQITRHDCVEGWSAIGKWTGVPLAEVLSRVEPAAGARYVVFHCADPMNTRGDHYYESIDFEDAWHPQTLLAYELNDEILPVRNGAPLRLRVERQLGYKMAKYLMRIELVESFDHIGKGRGGYWEDRGYEWYAGI